MVAFEEEVPWAIVRPADPAVIAQWTRPLDAVVGDASDEIVTIVVWVIGSGVAAPLVASGREGFMRKCTESKAQGGRRLRLPPVKCRNGQE
jgi:hypothetical protein